MNEQRVSLSFALRRWRNRAYRPHLAPADEEIVGNLKRTGAHVTSLDRMLIPGSQDMLAEADKLFDCIDDRVPDKGSFIVQANGDEIDECAALIRWGLDERLLAIVAAYIGLPVAYRGLTVRRDIAGGKQTETRLWHRDGEDARIVKIVVYVNDVGEDGGAYEFIPRTATPAT